MKVYTKPKMHVLSLSANDALCVGCTAQTRFDPTLNTLLIDAFGDRDNDGLFEPDDSEAFATTEGCQVTYNGLDSYCKFTAADMGMRQLFTS